jgi:hypothetical protein
MWPFGPGDRIDADGRRLGASLLNLEINTIVSEGITAERMPVLPHALLDIIKEYVETLLLLELPLAELDAWMTAPDPVRFARPPAPLDAPRDGEAIIAASAPNLATFARLRCAALATQALLDGWERAQPAAAMRDRAAADRREANRRLAARMVNNLETINEVLKRITDDELILHLQFTRAMLAKKYHPPPEWLATAGLPDRFRAWVPRTLLKLGPYTMPPSDFLAIRKVWEIGTAEIVAQTVISLDGDVVTRLTPALLRAEARPLADLHQRGVETSVDYWNAMVNTLVTVVGKALGVIFRR